MQNKDARTLALVVGIIFVCVCASCVTTVGLVMAAVPPVRTILLSNPKTAEDYNRRGLAFYDLGQNEQASADFTKAIELNPTYAEAYYNRGNARTRLGEYEDSIADYTRAIEINPNYGDAYFGRGNRRINVGQYEDGVSDFKKATEVDPKNAAAWNNLCWYGSALGHAADVMPACERAVELNPNNGGFRDSRGLARALTGDYKDAIQDFKAYVTWSKQNGLYELRGYKREEWITELEAGRNPFDAATLKELLND